MKDLPYVFVFPMVFLWILPFSVVTYIEKRSFASMGFRFDKERIPSYLYYTALGFLILTTLLGLEQAIRLYTLESYIDEVFTQETNILLQLLIQLGGIGLPEEIFFRGYLSQRFGDWLGQTRGLILSSLFFGTGHFISRVLDPGEVTLAIATLIGLQTFISGIVLGYLLIKTKTISVPATSHILLNVFGVMTIKHIMS